MGSHFEEVAAALLEEKRAFIEKWRAEKKRADAAEEERDREKEQAQVSEDGFAAARLTIAELVSEKVALEAALAAEKARADAAVACMETADAQRNNAADALAAARRECEGLRAAVRNEIDKTKRDIEANRKARRGVNEVEHRAELDGGVNGLRIGLERLVIIERSSAAPAAGQKSIAMCNSEFGHEGDVYGCSLQLGHSGKHQHIGPIWDNDNFAALAAPAAREEGKS